MLTKSLPGAAPVIVLACHLMTQTFTDAVTNSWTSPMTGNWHDPAWSSGARPGVGDTAVAITNHGSKAVIIGAVTAEEYPDSLRVQDLLLSSPVGWTNTLLLNYLAGRPPLQVAGTGWVGTNGVFINLYSGLHFTGTNSSSGLVLDGGSFIQEGGSTEIANQLRVGETAPGYVALTNAILTAREIILGRTSGEFLQQGGEVEASLLDIGYSQGVYRFNSGFLNTERLRVGEREDPFGIPVNATFIQEGGTNQSEDVTLGHSGSWAEYELRGGLADFASLIVSQSGMGNLLVTGGRMEVGSLTVANNDRASGHVELEGGELFTEFVTVGYSGDGFFRQNGGIHKARHFRVSGDSYRWVGSYTLADGRLEAEEIELTTGVMSQSGGTNLVTGGVSLGGHGSGYYMEGGLLKAASIGVSRGGTFDSVFTQSGGRIELTGGLYVGGEYNLEEGVLVAPAVSIGEEAELTIGKGELQENQLFTFNGGGLFFQVAELNLGVLQVLEDFAIFGSSRIAFPATNAILTFADSHAEPWAVDVVLMIYGWDGAVDGNGKHQLRVGSDGFGLTRRQLATLRFEGPGSFPPGSYYAAQLPSGEIVPTERAMMDVVREEGSVVFHWPPGWTLHSATQVEGPYEPVLGAESPHSTAPTGPRRFFRLQRNSDL